ncbi:hypothetical protein GUITHDRAFT_153320 [Guillardia theta CCMP2712]|uniref:Uncharacterized protein n=1 Tax=Guillardia theta (strain CCMP2712) TaxID=905079 RepID=L1J4U2_GUITC|nr:hypothetical protein GUITHDRAFT_153320 [Guillardia theta CCMP2712]EKX43322.1 hypothetical protein GUITHDRAFT_153320 [Guillardia theta CCMP2712]|eukprot:XP_005830302.1 hypothetical protein GUITHDRAFT_153320 [Guillardia theta CCMP2712]
MQVYLESVTVQRHFIFQFFSKMHLRTALRRLRASSNLVSCNGRSSLAVVGSLNSAKQRRRGGVGRLLTFRTLTAAVVTTDGIGRCVWGRGVSRTPGVLPSSTALFEGRSLARRTTLAIIRIRGAIAHLHGIELPVGICSRRMFFGSGLIVDLERVLPELTEVNIIRTL